MPTSGSHISGTEGAGRASHGLAGPWLTMPPVLQSLLSLGEQMPWRVPVCATYIRHVPAYNPCIHACSCVCCWCVPVHTHACSYTYVSHVHTLRIGLPVCMCVHTYTFLCTSHMCMHVHLHVCTHVHGHLYKQTHLLCTLHVSVNTQVCAGLLGVSAHAHVCHMCACVSVTVCSWRGRSGRSLAGALNKPQDGVRSCCAFHTLEGARRYL